MKLKLSANRWYLYFIPGCLIMFGVLVVTGLIIGSPDQITTQINDFSPP